MTWYRLSYACINTKCSEMGVEELKSRESDHGGLFYYMSDRLKQFEVVIDANDWESARDIAISISEAIENMELDELLALISEHIDSESPYIEIRIEPLKTVIKVNMV